MKKELIKNMVSLIVGEALLEFIENPTSPKIVNDLRDKYSEKILSAIDFMQEESTISVWHSAKDEEPTKGRKIVVLTSVCNIADKNISFTGEYIGNGYVQVFNAKEYINSWAKWAYTDDLLKL